MLAPLLLAVIAALSSTSCGDAGGTGSRTPCGIDTDCPSGERCNAALDEPECIGIRTIGEGQPCADELCEADLICAPDLDGCDEARTCVATRAEGASCCSTSMCDDALACVEGTCVGPGGIAAPCDSTIPCAEGLVCTASGCSDGNPGSPCSSDDECASQYCYEQKGTCQNETCGELVTDACSECAAQTCCAEMAACFANPQCIVCTVPSQSGNPECAPVAEEANALSVCLEISGCRAACASS